MEVLVLESLQLRYVYHFKHRLVVFLYVSLDFRICNIHRHSILLSKMSKLPETSNSSLQPNESLYDQKPEEPAPAPVVTTANGSSIPKSGSSYHPSRFEYTEMKNGVSNYGGTNLVVGHVTAPKTSSFFSDFGMDSGFQKKSSTTTKIEV